jgi:DNA replication protein DnaC
MDNAEYKTQMVENVHTASQERESRERGDADPDCPLCKGLGVLREQRPIDDARFGKLAPCECTVAARSVRRRAHLEEVSGLLPHERALSLDDLVERCDDTPEMIRVVRRFGQWPSGILTLWGECGNGKTLCLQALANHFRDGRQWVSVYARFKDLVDWIRAGNSTDATEDARERYERLKTARFLAIDEIDKVRMTEFAHEFRTALLDDRYRLALEKSHFTALACNDDPAELPEYIFDRLRDGRFGENAIFHNGDKSMRPSLIPDFYAPTLEDEDLIPF